MFDLIKPLFAFDHAINETNIYVFTPYLERADLLACVYFCPFFICCLMSGVILVCIDFRSQGYKT